MHTVSPRTAAVRLSILFCSIFLLWCATLVFATKPIVWCAVIAGLIPLLTPALVIRHSSN
jgi:hypothetical protein